MKRIHLLTLSGTLRHETRLAKKHWLATLLDGARLEGDLALRATVGADYIVHFAGTAFIFEVVPAVLAPLRRAEILRVVEFLLSFAEAERCSATSADDGLIRQVMSSSRGRVSDENVVCYLGGDHIYRVRSPIQGEMHNGGSRLGVY